MRMGEEHHFVFGDEGPVEVSRDEFAETLWPYRTRSPAWFAARMAHNIGCLSPDRWADRPELHRWLQELVAILQVVHEGPTRLGFPVPLEAVFKIARDHPE